MGTNNYAKLRTMRDEHTLCKALRICNLELECDSSLVVFWLTNGSCMLWYL